MMASSSSSSSKYQWYLQQSASHTRSKMIQLVHTWTIDHFDYHCNEELSEQAFLDSSKFSPYEFNSERLRFFLRVHPRGDKDDEATKENVPIYLHMESNDSSGVNVQINISIVKPSGEKSHTKEETKELFNDGKWGWSDYVQKNLLDSANGLLTDGQLKISCKVDIIGKTLSSKSIGKIKLTEDGKVKHSLKTQSLNSFSDSWTNTLWQVDKFSHIWTIDNFSKLSVGNKKEFPLINSKEFASCQNENEKFYLKLNPNGWKEEYKNNISMFLQLSNSDSQSVRILFKLALLDDQGNEFNSLSDIKRLDTEDPNWGWFTFISHKDLFESSNKLLQDDKLTIYCEITNFLGIKTVASSTATQVQLQLNLSQQAIEKASNDFNNLLKNRIQSDVTFVIGNKELVAHKSFLIARSVVFTKMFEHDLVESKENRVEIVDIEPEVFEEFLHFVYTGKVDKLDQFGQQLLMVSEKYQMDSLKSICEAALLSSLTLENVVDFLLLADLHGAKKLKAKAIEFIVSEGSSIINLESFKNLMKNYTELANETICAAYDDL